MTRFLCVMFALSALLVGCGTPVTSNSVVEITSGGDKPIMSGTGIVVAKIPEGYVVITAGHVVVGGPRWLVNDEPAERGLADFSADIAIMLLKSDRKYVPLKLRPTLAEVATPARLFGYPSCGRHTLCQTRGQVMGRIDNLFEKQLLYDGGCHPGFSGGPLVDDLGTVIGMVNSHSVVVTKLSGLPQLMTYDTAANCIPSTILVDVLRNFVTLLRIPQPYLGS